MSQEDRMKRRKHVFPGSKITENNLKKEESRIVSVTEEEAKNIDKAAAIRAAEIISIVEKNPEKYGVTHNPKKVKAFQKLKNSLISKFRA